MRFSAEKKPHRVGHTALILSGAYLRTLEGAHGVSSVKDVRL